MILSVRWLFLQGAIVIEQIYALYSVCQCAQSTKPDPDFLAWIA